MKRLATLIMIGLTGCGGGSEASRGETEEWTVGSERTASESHVERDDGMQVEGLEGTIDPAAVEAGVSSALQSIVGCFGERYDELEVLSGDFTLGFRIARDGSVISARLLDSTVGDRETERCVVRAARAIRFTRPSNGEAEASHSLGIDLPDDVRPPVSVPVAQAQRLVSSNGGHALKLRCGAEAAELAVTAYVAPGGRAMAVGAAGDVESRALDCVADAVRGWRFSDPGSYPAKVTIAF